MERKLLLHEAMILVFPVHPIYVLVVVGKQKAVRKEWNMNENVNYC